MSCDVIDRKTAIECITETLKGIGAFDTETLTVKGKWLNCGRYSSRCSECKKMVYWDKEYFEDYKFCPHCGAEMKGEEQWTKKK